MAKKRTQHDTVIRDPRFNPRRGDLVFAGGVQHTVEFVSDVSPNIQLVGFTSTPSGTRSVVSMTAWRDVCRDADAAIDPTAPIN